ncbi:MAG: hypothetical protein M1812_007403 [Candelaria pacifica]|nr:MAG: hypothetical protein M1812_007403 [Candelaria pacifica]
MSTAATPDINASAANATIMKKPFPFLDLPPEIRNMIYNYILQTPAGLPSSLITGARSFILSPTTFSTPNSLAGSIVEIRHPLSFTDEPIRSRRQTQRGSILRVNKQIHNEAVPICYQINSFQFMSTASLVLFLNGIGKLARENVKEVFLCWWDDTRFSKEAFGMLARCEGLRYLWINIHEFVQVNYYGKGWYGDAEGNVKKDHRVLLLRDTEAVAELAKLRGLLGLWVGSAIKRGFKDVGFEDWLRGEVTKPRLKVTE